LQHAYDEKETKYNHLLREVELRDMQIASLENLIKRKEENIENLQIELDQSTQEINMNHYNKNNVNNFNTENKFKRTGVNTNTKRQMVDDYTYSNTNTHANNNTTSQSTPNFFINNRNSEAEGEFIRNEENEKELQKLIGNYSQLESSDNSNSNNYAQNSNDFKNKTPGRIYSIKRK
jgi:hypothetical protein